MSLDELSEVHMTVLTPEQMVALVFIVCLGSVATLVIWHRLKHRRFITIGELTYRVGNELWLVHPPETVARYLEPGVSLKVVIAHIYEDGSADVAFKDSRWRQPDREVRIDDPSSSLAVRPLVPA